MVHCSGRDLLRQYIREVLGVDSDGRVQISNNKGHVNGWCCPDNIYGIVVEVVP